MLYKEREFQVKSDMRIKMRNAEKSDAQDIINFNKKMCKDSHFNVRYDFEVNDDILFMEQKIEEYKESDKKIMMLICEGGDIIGINSLSPVTLYEKTAHRAKYRGGILLDYCGYGIGRIAFEEIFAVAKNMPYTQYEVELFADNHRALSIYEATGFKEWARIPRAYKIGNDYVDKLIYGKEV